MKNERLRQDLKECVKRHVGSLEASTNGQTERVERYVSVLCLAYSDFEDEFSVCEDAIELEELGRVLNRLIACIASISTGTGEDMRHSYREVGARSLGGLDIANLGDIAVTAEANLQAMRTLPRFNRAPGRKRNWRATNVALTCKYIWGEESWLSSGGKIPPSENCFKNAKIEISGAETWEDFWRFESFLLSLSPRSQNHLRPGPFGLFIEDVFEKLGILTQDGNPVSAATALASLAEWRRQEKKQE